MLSPETRYTLNQLEAAASVMDGEAIMMNLTQGVYYSTDGAGARIWELAAAGYTAPEIADALCTEYAVSPEQARPDVNHLLDQFVQEKLLYAVQRASPPPLLHVGLDPAAYHSPTLEIYREMGHLLALDPPMPGIENISWDDPIVEVPPTD